MGKPYSKEQVIVAQNANGEASSTATQYHNEKLALMEILIAVTVVILVLGVLYFIFKKCNKNFVRTMQRELNRNNIATISRADLTSSAV